MIGGVVDESSMIVLLLGVVNCLFYASCMHVAQKEMVLTDECNVQARLSDDLPVCNE